MGLRINTNQASITALRNLRLNDSLLNRSLERLSTGLRINRAGDDPAGLVISEQLRAQIKAMEQAQENTQNAVSMVQVADSALQEVADLLIELEGAIIFSLNNGSSSADQIAAEQFAIDNILSAIDRISDTTRYAGRALLNGNQDFILVSASPDLLDNLTIRGLNFAPGEDERTLEIIVRRNPDRAAFRFEGVSGVTAGTTIRIQGVRGTEDVGLASAASAQQVAAAINSVAGFTGVWASGTAGPGGTLHLFSEEFGETQTVRLEMLEGQISATTISTLTGSASFVDAGIGTAMTAGEILFDRGTDGQVEFNGAAFDGIGRHFRINSRVATLEFDLDPELIPVSGANLTPFTTQGAASASFVVGNTGLNFQLNELPLPTDQLKFGIASMSTERLGIEEFRDRISEAIAGVSTGAVAADQIVIGGFLNSLRTGGGNDMFQNPDNAAHIVQASLKEVTNLRAFLGALQAQNLEVNERQLGVSIENVTAAMSHIRDLDFAEEIASFTKRQIIFQSSIAVLANANAIPQAVLPLISG